MGKEDWKCYDVELPDISYCIEGVSSGNAKLFIMYTALKIAVVDGGWWMVAVFWHEELGILRKLGSMFSVVFIKLC